MTTLKQYTAMVDEYLKYFEEGLNNDVSMDELYYENEAYGKIEEICETFEGDEYEIAYSIFADMDDEVHKYI